MSGAHYKKNGRLHATLYRGLRYLYPGGLETQRHLRELKKTQWLSRDNLERWQLKRIQNMVKYAYENVPFYREKYHRENIRPEDIKSFEDFKALPFLTREDINNNLEKMVAPQLRKKAFIETTSGSVGEPTRFYIDDSFWWWNAAFEFRCREWYGIKEGDRLAWIWGDKRDMLDWDWKSRLKASVMQQRFLNAYSLTEEKMRAFAEMLVRWQPTIIRAYTSALELFAQFIESEGIHGIRPRIIETSAEKNVDVQRELFEKVFHCDVVDCYAAREFATIAYECEEGGRHVCETRYPEIIVKDKPAQPGGLGGVVITSLTQFAMPFIRYKNGDMAIFNKEFCPCGREMPVFQEIVGRIRDFLVTANGQFINGGYFVRYFRQKPEVLRFQAHQYNRHYIEIKLITNTPVTQVWIDNIKAEIQARFGEGTDIIIQLVDKIELGPSGKHHVVISDIKPDFL
jgi:phenylacetate-CoA ligase